MIDTKLIEFVKGQVSFRAVNGNLEKFINLSQSRGIHLFDLIRIEEGLQGQTYCREYKKAAACAKKCGVRLQLQEKRGLPFFLHRYRKRAGILVGICFFLTFLLVSQNFLWEISYPEEYGKEEQAFVSQMLQEYGVKQGAYLPKLNFRRIQHDLMQETEYLSWIALNRKGSRLEVKFTPREKPEEFASDVPCDVVAQRAGQILHIEALSGETVVKPKQIVEAGDLLISGILDNPVEHKGFYTHADGRVFAQTVRKKTLSFSLIQKEKLYSGKEKVRKSLCFMSANLPLYIAFDLPGEYEMTAKEHLLVLNEKKMPFGIEEKTYRFYETVERSYTEEEAKEILRQGFAEYEKEELSEAEIIKTEEGWEVENGVLIGVKKYVCKEDIAKKVKISQANEGESTKN